MRKAAKKLKNKKSFSALFIVAVTVLYLAVTAAFAQKGSVGGTYLTDLTYSKDYLSYGDLWEFSESLYNLSAYGTHKTAFAYQYYANSGSDEKTEATTNSNYYGSVTFNDHGAITGDELDKHVYNDFVSASGLVQDGMAGINGSTINTIAVSGADYGSYAVIPNDSGTYHVYVYSESDPSDLVRYHVIQSYGTNDSYATGFDGTAFTATNTLNFERVGDTYWWKSSEIKVENNFWTAREVSSPMTSTVQGSSKDSNTGTSSGSTIEMTLSTTTYYINTWSSTEVRFNSLIIVQWDASVTLGPISEDGAIKISHDSDTTDGYTGTVTAMNFFGEAVTTGSSTTTPHLPIYFTGTAGNDDSVFNGLAEVTLTDGRYDFGDNDENEASELTLSGAWEEKVDLPLLSISSNDGTYTAAGDFYAMNSISASFLMGSAPTYTLTADFTGLPDGSSVGYVISTAGSSDVSGTLTASNNTITLPAELDKITVTLTENISGLSRVAVVKILPDANLPYVAMIKSTGTKYKFIEDAIAEAVDGDIIIVTATEATFYTAEGENFVGLKKAWTQDNAGYTIDSGVTLVLPYASGCNDVKGSSDSFPYANYTLNKTSSTLDPYDGVYVTLTVPESVEIVNNGIIAVGGQVTGDTTQGYAGVTVVSHSNMILNGTLKVGSTGVLSVTGYILGSGTVTTEGSSGAKIYELFSVLDFMGGGYTVLAAGNYDGSAFDAMAVDTKSGEDYITPFNRYAMLGIQTELTITKGNYLYGYCDLYAGSQDNQTTALVIGDSSTSGVLVLTGSGSSVTATYDANTYVDNYSADSKTLHLSKVGKTTLTVTGGAALGSMSLDLYLVVVENVIEIDASVKTSAVTFPLPYNYDIVLESGDYAIENDFSLLPGASLTVGEEATLTVGSSSATRFTVYDGLFDHRDYDDETFDEIKYHVVSRYTYPNTQRLQAQCFGGNGAANLIVDGGTLKLGANVTFGGLVQTTGTGSLEVATGAALESTVQYGVIGNEKYGALGQYFYCYAAGATVSTVTGRVVDPHTGEDVPLKAGLTYSPRQLTSYMESFTYTLYGDTDDTSVCKEYTDALNAQVQGAWYSYTATLTDGTDSATAYFAHGADVSDYYTDAACTTAATTVTANYQTYYYLTPAARVDWADGSASTAYASLQLAVEAATHAGDVVVLLKSVELSSTIEIKSTQNMTLDLNGYDITSTKQVFLNNGTLILNMNGGTIAASENAMETVYNKPGAAMTVTGEGVISNSTIGVATIVSNNSGQNIYYAATVRNEGTLTMENVTIQQTGDSTYNVALINFDTGVITSMTGVTINSADATNKGYAIYNLGATIEKIDSCYIYGYYGIYNRNIRIATLSLSAGGNTNTSRRVEEADVGYIGTITDSTIAVSYRYGIYNYAKIGTITGDTTISAVGQYGIYNEAYWYYDSAAYSQYYQDTNGDGREDCTYLYDEENRPTIETISGNVTISAPSYAIVNAGFINTINGSDVAITTTGSYGILNIWKIGSIEGTVTVTSGNHAIYNGLLSTTYYARAYTKQVYCRLYDSSGAEYERVYDYTFGDSKIGSIGGTSSDTIKINSSGTYAVTNKGDIDLIGRGTTITLSSTTTTTYGINNSNTRLAGYKNVISPVGEKVTYDGTTYAYANQLVTTNRYKTSTIDKIDGGAKNGITISMTCTASITATTERDLYGIFNAGLINTMKYVTVKGINNNQTVDGSKVYNYPRRVVYNSNTGPITGETTQIAYYYGDKFKIGSEDGVELTRLAATWVGTIDYGVSTIKEITNCTITTYKYGLENRGYIGTVTNTAITTSNVRAVNQDTRATDKKVYSLAAEEYAAQVDCSADSFPTATAVTYYEQPVIDLLGAGNTFKSSSGTVYNKGRINAIDGGGTTVIQSTSSTVAVTTGAIVNLGALTLTDENGTSYYQGAVIGSISNVTVTAKGYPAILNYASNNYTGYTTTIGELGSGVIAYSSSNYAVYANDLYEETEITLISGGYYLGNGDREYAIYLPDEQNYPEGSGLSYNTSAVSVSGTNRNCYYVCAHSYKSTVTAPTCTEDGYTTHTCSTCGHSYEDSVVTATGHDYNGVDTDPTCTEKGYTTYTCSKCGDSYVDAEFPATGHSYAAVVTAPTCTTGGFTTYTCTACGDSYVGDEVAAAGHQNETVEGIIEATCTQKGYTGDTVCGVCGEKTATGEEIAALGHTLTEHPASEATCTAEGNTAYWSCEVCGCYFSDKEGTTEIEEGSWVIEKTDHTFDEDGVCACGWFKFYGANVNLGNDLDMIFAFPTWAQTDWNGCYVSVTRTYADGSTKTTACALSDWVTETIGGKDYYVITYGGFAAKEMCDTVTLTVRDVDGNAIGESWTDSIQAYALRALNSSAADKYLCAVIMDMLNYGAACQTALGYPNENPTAEQLVTYGFDAWSGYATQNLSFTTDYYAGEREGTHWSASNLVTTSNIQFCILFTDLTGVETVSYSFTGHKGNTVEVTDATIYQTTDGYSYIKIEELVVADAGFPITVTLYDSNGEKIETWRDSIKSYAARMSSSSDDVFNAFMKFAHSAYTYLHVSAQES